MTNKKLQIAVTFALVSAAALANAQGIRPAYSYPSATAATGGYPLADSGFFASPFIGLGYGYDDNLFTTSTNERSSNFWVANPGIRIDGRRPGMVAQFSYQAARGEYMDSHADDYTDQFFHGVVDMALSGRSFVRLGYDYVRGHDPRGSTDRGLAPSPDKYSQYTPSATYAFGAPGAQGRVELYYSDAHKKYLNNRATTAASDRDTTEYGGAFYWRVMPKTYVLVEARQTDISYEQSNSPASGQERRYFGGVSWEATAATTGTLKFGQLKREFDIGSPSTSDSTWEGLITWAPRTYSTFDFYTSRQTTESTGLGRFILTDTAGVNWNHSWSSLWTTGVNLRFTRDDYQGFDRQDDTRFLGLRVGYKFRRWLTIGAEYNYTNRDSNINTFEYNRNFYLLTATASM